MAALSEVTRVFNGDSVKILGNCSDISVQADGEDFTAFTSALASCAKNKYEFNAELLSDARVWVEFNGQYIHIHGPDCITPHNDERPHHFLPRCWKSPFVQTKQDCVPIEKYNPDQELETSMKDTLSSLIKNKEWDKAYQAFFQMLPRMVSENPLPVIRDLTAQKSDLSHSAKATIAVALFWLGLQSVKKRKELAKACYLQGLNILKTIGVTKEYPAMALRVQVHLADLYQEQGKKAEEIDMRQRIVKELQMHDDAIHGQLARLLELDPDTDLEALGIKDHFPERFLTALANTYQGVNRRKAEAHFRIARLKEYFTVASPECLTEMPLIIEGDPDQNVYDIFPMHKYPSNLLFAIAEAYQKQEKTEKEIEARKMALKLYHKPGSDEFKTQISRILEADPNFNPHSIYTNLLPKHALLHVANIYKSQNYRDKEIETRCMAIRLHMRTRTPFVEVQKLFELDPDAGWYAQLDDNPQTRKNTADGFRKDCEVFQMWSQAHILARHAFNEDSKDLFLAKKMLEHATKANEVDNTIAAHLHVLRLAPTQENIRDFLQYCEKLDKLSEPAEEQLYKLPKVEVSLDHSNNLVQAAKILEKTQPEKARHLAIQASTHCIANVDAHKYLLALFQKFDKQSEAVDLLTCIATQLKTTEQFSECIATCEFLKAASINTPDLEKLYFTLPLMKKSVKQENETQDLKAKINKLESQVKQLVEFSLNERLATLESNNGYGFVLPSFSAVWGGTSNSNTPRESAS